MPNGIGGHATRLNGETNFPVSDTANTSVTAVDGYVGLVSNISLPEIGVTDIDISSFDSAENYMEFIAGAKDPGVIDVELNYSGAETTEIYAAVGDAVEDWQLTFPDGSWWRTAGYVNKILGGTTTTNDKINSTLSIKCTGIPTQSTTFLSPGAAYVP